MGRSRIGPSASLVITTRKYSDLGKVFFALAWTAFCGACSSDATDHVLDIRITDAESQPLYQLASGDTKAARIWVRDPKALTLEEVNVEIIPDGCVSVGETSLVLTSDLHRRESGEMVVPIQISADDQCPSGTQAALLVRAHSAHQQRTVSGEFQRRLTITPSTPRPKVVVKDLRINGVARRSVFAGETFKVGLSMTNDGSLAAENLQIQVELGDGEGNKPALSLTQALPAELAVGEFFQLDWQESFTIPSNVETGVELPVIVRWQSHDGRFNGHWSTKVVVAASPRAENVMINGRSEVWFQSGEPIDLSFDLVNPSPVSVGPGEMKIVGLQFAEVIAQMDQSKFSDLAPNGSARVGGQTLRILPHVSSLNGVLVTLRWTSIYGFSGTFDLALKSKEAR